MWEILGSLVANNDMKIGNEEVKNPRPEVGSNEGSQRDSIEYEENKALKEPSLRDSTQIIEQEDSQKEIRTDTCPTKKNLLTTKESLKRRQRKGFKRMINRYIVNVEDTAVCGIWTLKNLS